MDCKQRVSRFTTHVHTNVLRCRFDEITEITPLQRCFVERVGSS